jgi:hypothetical protein
MGAARTRPTPPGVTLDAGALIALDRGDRRLIALIAQTCPKVVTFACPTPRLESRRNDSRPAPAAAGAIPYPTAMTRFAAQRLAPRPCRSRRHPLSQPPWPDSRRNDSRPRESSAP